MIDQEEIDARAQAATEHEMTCARICRQVELAAAKGCDEASVSVDDARYLLHVATYHAQKACSLHEASLRLRHEKRSGRSYHAVRDYILTRDGSLPMTVDELKEVVFEAYRTTDDVYELAKFLERAGVRVDANLVYVLIEVFGQYPELVAAKGTK